MLKHERWTFCVFLYAGVSPWHVHHNSYHSLQKRAQVSHVQATGLVLQTQRIATSYLPLGGHSGMHVHTAVIEVETCCSTGLICLSQTESLSTKTCNHVNISINITIYQICDGSRYLPNRRFYKKCRETPGITCIYTTYTVKPAQ